jgi:ACS family glucarate transporter-like MFS transporter
MWVKWYRDEPREHASITSAEVTWIESNRPASATVHSSRWLFSAARKTPGIWALCVMYFTQSYGFNFYVTWMLTWLAHEKGLHGTALGFFAGLPLLLSVPADLFGGLLTDFLCRRFGLRFGRCIVGGASLAAASAFLLLGISMQGYVAATFVALGAALSNFLLGASWSTCSDIAGDHAAVISAAMNTCGQVGGVLSPIVFAYLTRGKSNWSGPLYVMVALYALGAVCWYFVHPERPFVAPVLYQL